MRDLLKELKAKSISLPDNVVNLLENCKSYTVFDTTDELAIASTNGLDNNQFEVKYDVPGKG
ncbi:MAG: hypothetical protein GVY19_08625, partial [Bacteroidetes bacterium]|nr:hypothetical protein [Bacteroidota bacterium]